jgi:hypothetical protein
VKIKTFPERKMQSGIQTTTTAFLNENAIVLAQMGAGHI